MKLKVCGMKYQDNILAVADLQPDYLGFIFYEKSARYFQGKIGEISKSIKKVGVFVDEEIYTVIDLIKSHSLQAIQLHGNESPAYCDELKSRHIEVIKVFSILNSTIVPSLIVLPNSSNILEVVISVIWLPSAKL